MNDLFWWGVVPVAFVALLVATYQARKRSDRVRAAYIREAQRFAEHPWRQSLRTAPLAGLVAIALLQRPLAYGYFHGVVALWLAVGLGGGVALAWPFFYRFWLGPYLCRKYLGKPWHQQRDDAHADFLSREIGRSKED
jgi:hypothetical protein